MCYCGWRCPHIVDSHCNKPDIGVIVMNCWPQLQYTQQTWGWWWANYRPADQEIAACWKRHFTLQKLGYKQWESGVGVIVSCVLYVDDGAGCIYMVIWPDIVTHMFWELHMGTSWSDSLTNIWVHVGVGTMNEGPDGSTVPTSHLIYILIFSLMSTVHLIFSFPPNCIWLFVFSLNPLVLKINENQWRNFHLKSKKRDFIVEILTLPLGLRNIY